MRGSVWHIFNWNTSTWFSFHGLLYQNRSHKDNQPTGKNPASCNPLLMVRPNSNKALVDSPHLLKVGLGMLHHSYRTRRNKPLVNLRISRCINHFEFICYMIILFFIFSLCCYYWKIISTSIIFLPRKFSSVNYIRFICKTINLIRACKCYFFGIFQTIRFDFIESFNYFSGFDFVKHYFLLRLTVL